MLHGPRVTLRAITPEDYPRQRDFHNDLEFELAGGGSPPRPTSLPVFAEFFDTLLRDREQFMFGIEVSGVYIGNAGLFHVNRVDGTAELGIGIGDKTCWSHGYGRESIGLLLDYAFRVQNLRRVWLEVLGSNGRAQRCYRSAGFVEEGRLREHVWNDGRYVDHVLMAVLREDGQPAPG